MPNWYTSLVEDMSGWSGSASQGFGDKFTFNGDISKWDTGKVTDMGEMFSYCFSQVSVFQLPMSPLNDEVEQNIQYMLVTEDVSQLEMSPLKAVLFPKPL